MCPGSIELAQWAPMQRISHPEYFADPCFGFVYAVCSRQKLNSKRTRIKLSSTPLQRMRASSFAACSQAFRPKARCRVRMRGFALRQVAGKSAFERGDGICEIVAADPQHPGGNWIGRPRRVKHPRVL